MEGFLRGIALLLAAGAAGCCLTGRGTTARENRDTPGAAFAYVRAAFAEDRTGDQYDSLHPDFREEQGITAAKWSLARRLEPGLFERFAAILGEAEITEVVPLGTAGTAAGPRPAARVSLRTSGGGVGEFVLVDEPILRAWTDDAELPEFHAFVPGMDRVVRIEDGRIVVSLSLEPGAVELLPARVRRLEIHHDWLLFRVERLEGFDDLVREVREADEEANAEGSNP